MSIPLSGGGSLHGPPRSSSSTKKRLSQFRIKLRREPRLNYASPTTKHTRRRGQWKDSFTKLDTGAFSSESTWTSICAEWGQLLPWVDILLVTHFYLRLFQIIRLILRFPQDTYSTGPTTPPEIKHKLYDDVKYLALR